MPELRELPFNALVALEAMSEGLPKCAIVNKLKRCSAEEIAAVRGQLDKWECEIPDCLIEVEFSKLSEQWKQETGGQSSVSTIVSHPAYQRITEMGDQAIPLILKDLQEGATHWFHALAILTEANPVAPENQGRIQAMREAWLEWGTQNGY